MHLYIFEITIVTCTAVIVILGITIFFSKVFFALEDSQSNCNLLTRQRIHLSLRCYSCIVKK